MIDPFGRRIELLRISVTDRCNLRCVYCMPEEGAPLIPRERILSFEEIRDVVQTCIPLGIHRFRLTGGEPLVRKGITRLVRMIASMPGVTELAMTTNGTLLASLAQPLAEAGLNRVNISLDTMNPEKYRKLTRGGDIRNVLEGIEAAQRAGLTPVKINIVVPGDDDADAREVEAYGKRMGLTTRRILRMDIRAGTFSVVQNSDRGDCSRCNRLRLTSDGFIRSCLMSEIQYDIRTHGIESAIRLAVKNKPRRGVGAESAFMSRIGG